MEFREGVVCDTVLSRQISRNEISLPVRETLPREELDSMDGFDVIEIHYTFRSWMATCGEAVVTCEVASPGQGYSQTLI
jgi:hypothetical protein